VRTGITPFIPVCCRPTDRGLGIQLFTPTPTWTNPDPKGVRISGIFAESPAGRSNRLNKGDVILEINGASMVTKSHAQVVDEFRALWSVDDALAPD
jgi:C-terminal processing protease CtpA/Prc